MRSRILFIIFTIILAACAGRQSAQEQTASITPAGAGENITKITVTSTSSQTPVPTEAPPETETPIPSSSPTLEPSLCTPLGIHPLEELPEIIGDGYDPPRPGREERHHGIDFGYYHYQDRDSMLGEPVQSVLGGQVASVLTGQYPYGNMVMIETGAHLIPALLGEQYDIPSGKSLYILYAHLDQPPQVSLGDFVTACQPLGVVGMSGNTDIPHLHIETRWGPPGQVFESMRFYDTRATQAEMDAYVLWRTSGVFQHFDPLYLLAPQALPTPTPTAN